VRSVEGAKTTLEHLTTLSMTRLMMAEIEPGTPCFLVRTVEQPDWIGRVVSVVGRVLDSDEPGTEWYQVSSAWLKKQFPQSDVLVLRDNLSPIIPPVILPGIEAEA
jgi:hypothetical protein